MEKFLVYTVDMNNQFLWKLYQRGKVAVIAEWTVETIGRWGPDGNSRPSAKGTATPWRSPPWPVAESDGTLRPANSLTERGDAARRLAGAFGAGAGGSSPQQT
jgi:hypothetical protein